MTKRIAYTCLIVMAISAMATAAPIKALLVDGQNNHDWKKTSPILKRTLEKTGLFTVDVATSPPQGGDMASYNPRFKKYDVVVLNYNGDLWNKKVRDAFVDYVRKGGGVVVVHAADNSFGKWKEYNEIIGFGGWGGRRFPRRLERPHGH